MRCRSPAAWLIPHNCPLPGRHHALIAHGPVVADRQPFSDLATRPAVGRTPTSTDHAIVLDDYRHGRSVLAEGGPQKAQRGPVDEGGAVNVGPAADLEPSTVNTVSLMASTARKLAAMSAISVQVIAIEGGNGYHPRRSQVPHRQGRRRETAVAVSKSYIPPGLPNNAGNHAGGTAD
jgi:hypothetical protein